MVRAEHALFERGADTSPGPALYVEGIRRRARRDERRLLYASPPLHGLLRFLDAGRRAQSPDSPSPTRELSGVFVWILELKLDTAPVPRNVPSPDFLDGDSLTRTSAGPHGHLLLLRGYPSPPWLASLGSHYCIEDEVWRQHLDFLEPSSSDTFSHPALPSASCSILRLRVTTIGSRGRLGHTDDRVLVRQLRADAKRAMLQYRDSLRVGSGWRTGDSIVRDYTIHDMNHFSIDQRITICLIQVDRLRNCWQGRRTPV